MDLSKIISISGKPDLYKHIAHAKNSIVVESLVDKKRLNTFSTMKISALHDIAIYTEGEDVQLEDVFKSIYKKEDGKNAISHKASNAELKKFFIEVLPDYDQERVYVSDIKRVVKWYNLLNTCGLIDLESNEEEKNEEKAEKVENSEEKAE